MSQVTSEEKRGGQGKAGGGKSAEQPQGEAPSPLALPCRRWRQHRAGALERGREGGGEPTSGAALASCRRRRLDGCGPRVDWLPQVTWTGGPVRGP